MKPQWLLILLAMGGLTKSVDAAWTNPTPATRVAYQIGCGSDSGLSVQRLEVGSSTFFLRSSAKKLFDRSSSIASISVASQAPLQVFSFLAQTTTSYQVVDDSGRCSSGSAIEMIGIALDHLQISESTRPRSKSESLLFQRLAPNRVVLRSNEAWSLLDLAGRPTKASVQASSQGVILDISSLPNGTYFLRTGSKSTLLTKF